MTEDYCLKCRMLGRCLGSGADYYPMSVITFCRNQMFWMCQSIDLTDKMELIYPPDPSGSGYTDAPINSHRFGSQAPFVLSRMISGEVCLRLEACGISGLLLIKSIQKGEKYQDLLPAAKDALNYISGWKRKRVSFSDWKRIRRARNVTLSVTKLK